jgi:hypothetical protein
VINYNFFFEEMEKSSSIKSLYGQNFLRSTGKLIGKKKLMVSAAKLLGKKKLIAATVAAPATLVPIHGEYKTEVKADKKDIGRWKRIEGVLDRHGVSAGTAHNRVAIPKSKLNEQTINDLGFKKSLISVPEPGQDKFVSYRHPDNNYHIHSHKDNWVIHKDRHAASQMIALKKRSLAGKASAYLTGASHTITEGVPGMYHYLSGRVRKTPGMLNKVLSEKSKSVKRRMDRWVDDR